MKNNKGITLIALVVTIIVLLILAGVSIAMLTGQNGILNRASESSYETKLSSTAEEISYAATEAITELYHSSYVAATTTAKLEDSDVMKAIINAALDKTVSGGVVKAVAYSTADATDTAITASTDTTYTAATVTGGTVTLTYSGHTKIGTITKDGIAWGDIS